MESPKFLDSAPLFKDVSRIMNELQTTGRCFVCTLTLRNLPVQSPSFEGTPAHVFVKDHSFNKAKVSSDSNLETKVKLVSGKTS